MKQGVSGRALPQGQHVRPACIRQARPPSTKGVYLMCLFKSPGNRTESQSVQQNVGLVSEFLSRVVPRTNLCGCNTLHVRLCALEACKLHTRNSIFTKLIKLQKSQSPEQANACDARAYLNMLKVPAFVTPASLASAWHGTDLRGAFTYPSTSWETHCHM